jgi:predicted secreted protein
VKVKLGAEFTIDLEVEGTAGFRWTVELPPADAPVVELLGSEWIAHAETIGAPAVQQFRFRASHTGSVNLEFTCGRQWEQSPRTTRRVTVTVGLS